MDDIARTGPITVTPFVAWPGAVIVRWRHYEPLLYGVLRNRIPIPLRHWDTSHNGWVVSPEAVPLLREGLEPWGDAVIWGRMDGEPKTERKKKR